LAAVVSLSVAACSATSREGFGEGGTSVSTTQSGEGGASVITTSAGMGGATGDGGGGAGAGAKGDPTPPDLVVLRAQAGSMGEDAGNGMNKWQTVRSALTAFMQQPNTVGIGMGIQYFGLPQPSVTGCTALSCTKDADCTGGCTMCMPQGICYTTFNPDV